MSKIGIFVLLFISMTQIYLFGEIKVTNPRLNSHANLNSHYYSQHPDPSSKNTLVNASLGYATSKITLEGDGDVVQNSNDVDPAIIGPLYNHPNPFRFTQEHTIIGYELSKPMPITIYLYNIYGHLEWKVHIPKNEEGGKGNGHFNEVRFDRNSVDGRYLSSSVYFYIVESEGKVLGKGKMAIIP